MFTGGAGDGGANTNNTPEPATRQHHHKTPLTTTVTGDCSGQELDADIDRKSRDLVGDDDVRQSPPRKSLSFLSIWFTRPLLAADAEVILSHDRKCNAAGACTQCTHLTFPSASIAHSACG